MVYDFNALLIGIGPVVGIALCIKWGEFRGREKVSNLTAISTLSIEIFTPTNQAWRKRIQCSSMVPLLTFHLL